LDNIKINLKGIGYEYVDWIQLSQDKAQWCSLLSMLLKFAIHAAARREQLLEQLDYYQVLKKYSVA
jgi:hypothetical protein